MSWCPNCGNLAGDTAPLAVSPPRDLPKDEAIEVLIDRLSAWWQWPVAGGLVPKRLRTGSA
jgi:hypothetical protein